MNYFIQGYTLTNGVKQIDLKTTNSINLSETNNIGETINVIEPNMLASEMRMLMENKNTLTGYGDIYVGTGLTQQINFTYTGLSGEETKQISVPVTACLKAPEIVGDQKYTIVFDKNGIRWELK